MAVQQFVPSVSPPPVATRTVTVSSPRKRNGTALCFSVVQQKSPATISKRGALSTLKAACAPASGLIRTATTVGPPKWSAKICSFLVAVTAVVKAARAVATSLPATALNPHLAPQRLVLRLLPRSRRLHLPPHRRPSTHWMKTSRSKTEGNEATPHITGSSYEKAPHCKSELFF